MELKGKNEKIPDILSQEEKKKLLVKTIQEYSLYTYNRDLARAGYPFFSSIEVTKKLKEFGLIDTLREFRKKILILKYDNKINEAVDIEKLAKIILQKYCE